MSSLITGDNVADLLEVADSHDCSWANIRGLPVPYITDEHARIVYVDGRLGTQRYFEAVAEGLAELIGTYGSATIIPIQRRYRTTQRHTG